MLTANIFDAKIVDYKGEGNRMSGVLVEAGSVFKGEVARLGKVLLEAFIGEDASLGQTVHSFVDFNEDMVIPDEVMELVLVHDVGENVLDRDLHVFVAHHGSVEVEILDVNHHEACVFGG